MIKDAIISLLIGFLVAGKIIPPGDRASVAIALSLALIVFILVLWLDDLLHQCNRQVKSWVRWKIIQLKAWPDERISRHRRRKMIQEYVQGLQNNHRERQDYIELEEVTENGNTGNTKGTN